MRLTNSPLTSLTWRSTLFSLSEKSSMSPLANLHTILKLIWSFSGLIKKPNTQQTKNFLLMKNWTGFTFIHFIFFLQNKKVKHLIAEARNLMLGSDALWHKASLSQQYVKLKIITRALTQVTRKRAGERGMESYDFINIRVVAHHQRSQVFWLYSLSH